MKRLLLLLSMLAAPAFAGPSIVESGGYTFLPGMKLTGKGFFVISANGVNDVTAKATTGITIGTASGFPGLWLTTGGYTPSTANYALSDSGSGLQINTPSSMFFRVANATKMTMSTSALLFASGVDLTLVDATLSRSASGTITINSGSGVLAAPVATSSLSFGISAHTISGGTSTNSFKLVSNTSDGASNIGITINTANAFTTTAKLLSVQNNSSEKAFFDLNGGVNSVGGGFTAQGSPPTIPSGVGIAIGNVSSFAALCTATTSYSLSNCQLYSQGADTFLNAPAGNTLGFRINNAVLGTWGTAGLVIGSGGTAISKSVAGTGTLDFASAAISTCSADLTITVTGATAAAPVELGVPNGSVAAGSVFWSWTSATNTVSVRHCCVGAATCDPASGTFSARVMNP